MIDINLLKELGWSNELIAEISRVAEPMRQVDQKIGMQKASNNTINHSASNQIFADGGFNIKISSSHAIYSIIE